MNWNTVAGPVAVVIGLAAIVTSCVVLWLVREEARLTRYSVGIDTLLTLEDNWRGLLHIRARAAGEIAANVHGRNVIEVLDFFDTIGKLTKNGALDRELVWHTFYWPMANYWLACQDFVRQTQTDEGLATWADY